MRNATQILLVILAAAGPPGCILPDTGIVVYATQECGFQFSASTNWAWGINGIGDMEYITIDDDPIIEKWCLNPDEAELMQFSYSWIYLQIHEDIIATCEARAIEMSVGQNNCRDMASVTYSGLCPGEHEWCEDGTEDANDEVGVPDLAVL